MSRTGIYRSPTGLRFKVAGYRLHHGLVGAWLALTGLLLAVHDWRDRKHWWPSRHL